MGMSVGLNTAILALRAHQLAVDVASHNIANAQSPGYSRQRVLLRPLVIPGGPGAPAGLLANPGAGVDARDLHRVRDTFLDFQARQALGSASQWQTTAAALQRTEVTLGEPSDTGLSAAMSQFWGGWHDVVNTPESPAARSSLINAGSALASRFKAMRSDLVSQRGDLDTQVVDIARQVNDAAAEISGLNVQIAQFEAGGAQASDLRDRRDVLLDGLAKLGPMTYTEQTDNTVTVFWGSHTLVQANTAQNVGTQADPGQPGMNRLYFTTDSAVLDTSGGKLGGLTNARDVAIPGVIAKLDALAAGLITSINGAHSSGFGLDNSTGNAFLTGTDAATIGVDPVVAGSPEKVAAAGSANAAGDSAKALAIANLQLQQLMSGSSQTFDEYYGNAVTVLGADVAQARNNADGAALVSEHIERQRQSVSGVNIDEEVTNLNMSQHAYNASARVITTIDQMLDTLINRTAV